MIQECSTSYYRQVTYHGKTKACGKKKKRPDVHDIAKQTEAGGDTKFSGRSQRKKNSKTPKKKKKGRNGLPFPLRRKQKRKSNTEIHRSTAL